MADAPLLADPTIELNNARSDRELEQGRLNFCGMPAALFWLNPTLLRILQPLADETGRPLFRMLIAHSASLDAAEDYHAMITTLGATFEEGFLEWGKAVSAAGWGRFELPLFDPQQRRAIVRVVNPWELEMQRGLPQNWGCPFIQGKIIGIFSHAFGANCWADEVNLVGAGAELAVELHVSVSQRTIAGELSAIRATHQDEEQRRLRDEIAATAAELQRATEEHLRLQEQVIAMQTQVLTEISTPLIPLNGKVVLMPLVGAFDSQRTQLTVERLLQGVEQHRASVVILDITGVPVVDTHVASALMRAAQAVRLLGAQVVLTGIRPEVAQTLVGMGVSLHGIVTRGTLQSGIEYANSLQ